MTVAAEKLRVTPRTRKGPNASPSKRRAAGPSTSLPSSHADAPAPPTTLLWQVQESSAQNAVQAVPAITVPLLDYEPKQGIDAYLRQVNNATPMQRVAIERQGVQGSFVKDLSRRMAVPTSRFFTILGVPKATAEKKAASGQLINGSAGVAAVGMIRLVGMAQDMASNGQTHCAADFDAAAWLGKWIELPQPALGGLKPAALMDTPTGVEMVSRVLGAIESGAYL